MLIHELSGNWLIVDWWWTLFYERYGYRIFIFYSFISSDGCDDRTKYVEDQQTDTKSTGNEDQSEITPEMTKIVKMQIHAMLVMFYNVYKPDKVPSCKQCKDDGYGSEYDTVE